MKKRIITKREEGRMKKRILILKNKNDEEYYFDKELLASNNTDSLPIAINLGRHNFQEWFDKEFARTKRRQHQCAIWAPEYFDLWFDADIYDFEKDGDMLIQYCDDHKEKWIKYVEPPEKIIEKNGHKYQLIE